VDVHAVYRVFQNWFRPRRMRRVTTRGGITSTTTVLDVGGTELNWEYAQVQPVLTILNVEPNLKQKVGTQVVGDGCRLPFADDAFDFVFSNSVIEHVHDHEAFAREVARVGKKFYVQTPNKWFVIEPHLMTPLIHFLPKSWRGKLLKRFTVWGLIAKPSDSEAQEFLETTRLIGPRGLRDLFPGASLERERFLGMTKSIAVWGGEGNSEQHPKTHSPHIVTPMSAAS
jgi:SAM-dependent methyltransferase